MFHHILWVKASHEARPDVRESGRHIHTGVAAKHSGPTLQAPSSTEVWPVPGSPRRSPFPDGGSQAGPQGPINAVLV